MDPNYTSLTLNGKKHSCKTLLEDTENVLKSWSAPGWQKKIHLFIQDWLSPATHLEVSTSGSTGTPKTIKISKESMEKSALRTGKFFGLQPGDRALLCLPVDYIAGKMMVVRAFVLGLDLVTVYPSSDPLRDVDMSFKFAAMTPMQVHHAMNDPISTVKMNKIDTLIIGGGDMDPLLLNRVSKLTGHVYHTYGMTETLTHIAVKNLSGPDADDLFHALPGVHFRQDDRDCLVITDEELEIRHMVTNDQVRLASAKTFSYLGRLDNVINSGGLKINPEIIENKIRPHMKGRVIVTGKKDPVLGEKVVMAIELKDSGNPEGIRIVIGNSGLERHEKPREFYFVDFFPESSSGKILRKKLFERINAMKGIAWEDLD